MADSAGGSTGTHDRDRSGGEQRRQGMQLGQPLALVYRRDAGRVWCRSRCTSTTPELKARSCSKPESGTRQASAGYGRASRRRASRCRAGEPLMPSARGEACQCLRRGDRRRRAARPRPRPRRCVHSLRRRPTGRRGVRQAPRGHRRVVGPTGHLTIARRLRRVEEPQVQVVP